MAAAAVYVYALQLQRGGVVLGAAASVQSGTACLQLTDDRQAHVQEVSKLSTLLVLGERGKLQGRTHKQHSRHARCTRGVSARVAESSLAAHYLA